MCADGADVLHLPRTRLIAIRAARQGAHRTDIDALAAFIAFQMIAVVRRDEGSRGAIDDAQRPYAHAFLACAHAAETQDAARSVIEPNRRPLLLIHVKL